MPSLVKEMIAGALLALAVHRVQPAGLRVSLWIAPSVFYEAVLDNNRGKPSHCGVCDVVERIPGSLIVEISIPHGKGHQR